MRKFPKILWMAVALWLLNPGSVTAQTVTRGHLQNNSLVRAGLNTGNLTSTRQITSSMSIPTSPQGNPKTGNQALNGTKSLKKMDPKFNMSNLKSVQVAGKKAAIGRKATSQSDFYGAYRWVGNDVLNDKGNEGMFTIDVNPNNPNRVLVTGLDPWCESLDGYVSNGKLYIPNQQVGFYSDLNQEIWFINYTLGIRYEASGETYYNFKKSQELFYFTLDEEGYLYAGTPIDDEKFNNFQYSDSELEQNVCVASSALPYYDPDGQGYFYGFWLCTWITGFKTPIFSFTNSEWTYVGDAQFKDAWFTVWYEGEAPVYDVPLYRNNNDKNLFLLRDPFGNGTPWEGTNLGTTPGNIVFSIEDPSCVLIEPLVYTLTLPINLGNGAEEHDLYCYNEEGFEYFLNGESISNIKNNFMLDRRNVSTFNAGNRKVTIYNGRFSTKENLLNQLYYEDNIEGYIILPENYQDTNSGGNDNPPATQLSQFTFNPSEWAYMGDAEFKDAWFNNLWTTGESQPYNVPVYKNNANPNIFLLQNPYGPSTPYEDINESSMTGYIYIDATNPQCVAIRPAVYSLSVLFQDKVTPFYDFNDEGWFYFIVNMSKEDIISFFNSNGTPLSTYSASTGRITINNAAFSFVPSPTEEDVYYWTDTSMSGYIQLPGFGSSGSGTTTPDLTITYCANGIADQQKVISPNSNGSYEVELNNLDWFWFKDNSTNTTFMVNLYGSNLGSNLPAVNYLQTDKPYTYTPWRGNYKIVVSNNMEFVTVTTTTPKPSTIDLYLPGDYNNWAMNSNNKLTQTGNGTYTFTVPADITGGWKIGSELWQYDYGYTGAVNPTDTYQFTYNSTNNTTFQLNKGDVVNVKINPDLYYQPAEVTITRASQGSDQPSTGTSTTEINGVVYTLYTTEGYFEATDGSKAKGDVEIIGSTNGLTLRGIASEAFKGNGLINTVTIPEGAIMIGNEAFRDCINLQEVNLPSTLTTIGKYAFLNCSYLNTFSLPAKVNAVGVGAFQGCSDLEIFNFNQASLTSLPDAIFEGCGRLNEVDIPVTVTKIGANAFLSSGVVKIGATASVKEIGDRAFESSKIAQIDFDNVETIGNSAFKNTSIKAAHLPSNLKNLGAEAFSQCRNLAKVTLPSGLQSIGKSTFEGCTSLSSIDIPSSVTAIWERAFYNSGLVTVELSNNVTELGANALVTNTLTSVTLGSGITSLDNTPIYTSGLLRVNNSTPPALGTDRLNCEPTAVIVPKGAGNAYLTNSRWKNYNIIEEDDDVVIYLSAPGALTADLRMKQKLAAQVTSLTIVTSPSKGTLNDADWKSIKSNMTALIKLDISDADVEAIPAECFKDKKILTQIVLPKNLKTIGDKAFEGCTLLSGINLPSGLESIGAQAFSGCNSLGGAVVIPSQCSSLGSRAFQNCFAMESLTINSSNMKEIPESAFENCRNLDVVNINTNLTAIGAKAFAESGITEITLPSTLTKIGNSAFEGCFYLSSIALPSSLSSLGSRAFAKSGLVGINVANNLTVVEDETFASCDDLLFVNLAGGVTTLGSRALASPSISAISCAAVNPPTSGYDPFDGVNNYTCTLSIPSFSFNDYVSAQYWGAFVGIHDNIDVTIDGKADVTYVDEPTYQSLLRNSRAGTRVGKQARKASNALNPANFANLFNGAQMFVPDNVATRFFFNSSLSNYTIEYNGVNVTDQIDRLTGSWLAPPMSGTVRLKIVNSDSGVETVFDSTLINNNDVYDTMGRLLIVNATEDQIRALTPGLYIINGKKVMIK